MTQKDFQTLICDALSEQKEICNILNSEKSILVSCADESSFLINILESKLTFIHDEQEEKFESEYLASHSDEDFAADILDMAVTHLSFFLYFMVFSKLEEMDIIDRGLFYHLCDCIIDSENELDQFLIKVLAHFRLDDL